MCRRRGGGLGRANVSRFRGRGRIAGPAGQFRVDADAGSGSAGSPLRCVLRLADPSGLRILVIFSAFLLHCAAGRDAIQRCIKYGIRRGGRPIAAVFWQCVPLPLFGLGFPLGARNMFFPLSPVYTRLAGTNFSTLACTCTWCTRDAYPPDGGNEPAYPFYPLPLPPRPLFPYPPLASPVSLQQVRRAARPSTPHPPPTGVPPHPSSRLAPFRRGPRVLVRIPDSRDMPRLRSTQPTVLCCYRRQQVGPSNPFCSHTAVRETQEEESRRRHVTRYLLIGFCIG